MGRIVLFLVLMNLIIAAQASAADEVMTKAVKLYEKRHYEEAAGLLRANAASLGPAKQGSANLALGMTYFKNAVLHRELYLASTWASQDYLKKLSALRGSSRSRFVDLYMGEALIDVGKADVAAIYLRQFLANEKPEPQYQAIAQVSLGLSYQVNHEAEKAAPLWAAIDPADPELKAELAAAYSRAGLKDKDPIALAEESLAAQKKRGKPLSIRMVKSLLAVYARAGLTEKGLDLLKRADLKAFSFRETLGKTKVINFYDLSLLDDMASLYGQASIAWLEKAAADTKVKSSAEFYLAQAYALFGSAERSLKTAESFLATAQLPQQFKDQTRVLQGANWYTMNRKADAMKVWDELVFKPSQDPDVLAEILLTCRRLKAECSNAARQSATAVEAGEGRKFSTLNIALGKYHLGRLDTARAITYLEAGRDKSNKNKIESNDPEMLVSLADAYFRTKKFSEALEIYFEMSKQFPEVRQLQEAMQGVYAMEHKSAGDVKIN
jgi:pentatricopeptide repeat protein